ncbi:hypothetical protein QQF64_005129 [Cirrhinus molitorella]|uniref:NIDO domain-containing protein n=1 Tax=Cirrhinus molitorella TaxID=172907 RepID=A0ABR3MKG2_9TELE
MNYGEIAVTEHPVEAGYDTINSTNYFVIPESVNGSFISNLRNSSNVNVPGRWAFRVDIGPRNAIMKYNVVGFRVRLSSFSDLTQSGNMEMVLQQMKQELVNNICNNTTCYNICNNTNSISNICNNTTCYNICNNTNSISNICNSTTCYNICNNTNYISNICNNNTCDNICNNTKCYNNNTNSISNICNNNNTCDNICNNTKCYNNNTNSISNICNNFICNNNYNNICNNTGRVNKICQQNQDVLLVMSDSLLHPCAEDIVGLRAKLSSFSDLTDTGNVQVILQQIKQELVKYGLPNSVELKLRKVQKIKP